MRRKKFANVLIAYEKPQLPGVRTTNDKKKLFVGELQRFFEEYNSQGNDPGVVGRKMPLLTRLAGGIRAWSSFEPLKHKEASEEVLSLKLKIDELEKTITRLRPSGAS